MSTPQTIANFNGARPVIDPDNVAMLLIDHQSGLFQTIKDMPFTEVRANATTLAKVATLAKIPVITTASVPQGPNGPLVPVQRIWSHFRKHRDRSDNTLSHAQRNYPSKCRLM